jgi:hypothetical protein
MMNVREKEDLKKVEKEENKRKYENKTVASSRFITVTG